MSSAYRSGQFMCRLILPILLHGHQSSLLKTVINCSVLLDAKPGGYMYTLILCSLSIDLSPLKTTNAHQLPCTFGCWCTRTHAYLYADGCGSWQTVRVPRAYSVAHEPAPMQDPCMVESGSSTVAHGTVGRSSCIVGTNRVPSYLHSSV